MKYKQESTNVSDKCPVCQTDITPLISEPDARDQARVDKYHCERCGDFCLKIPLTDSLRRVSFLEDLLERDPQKMAVLSHWIRTEHESKKRLSGKDPIVLTHELVSGVIRNPRPSPMAQADNYVRWIGDNIKVGGRYAAVERLAIQAIVGSPNEQEFELVSSHLLNNAKLIDHGPGESGVWRRVTLSFDGWEHYEKLKLGHADSRRAFMAMQYNEEPLEDIFESVFKPAVKETGFDLFKLPDRPQPAGLIDDRLRVEIRTSRFLIADLTHGNRGAYWEAGYAEGMGKPVIYTCEKKVFEDHKSKPHFDTNHHLTILWDSTKPDDVSKELKATIRATLPAEAKLTDD